MATKPLHFKDAASCLRLTSIALKISTKDFEFFKKAMETYAQLRHKEILLAEATDLNLRNKA